MQAGCFYCCFCQQRLVYTSKHDLMAVKPFDLKAFLFFFSSSCFYYKQNTLKIGIKRLMVENDFVIVSVEENKIDFHFELIFN